MKVILETDDFDVAKFQKILTGNDDEFDILDSIIWELDYGEGESEHCTQYGNITIKQQS